MTGQPGWWYDHHEIRIPPPGIRIVRIGFTPRGVAPWLCDGQVAHHDLGRTEPALEEVLRVVEIQQAKVFGQAVRRECPRTAVQ